MNRDVLIFHGTAGNPQENWFPWLKEKLEKKGCRVFVPQFPTPEGESLGAWLKVLDGYKQYINKETILIGHSKGGLFLLRVLERLKEPIYASFFVSAPIGIKSYVYYNQSYKFAHGFNFDWKTIKSHSQHFTVYHSDDDPYTCLDNGKGLAKNLGIQLTFIPQAGHFNEKSGYIKFDRLLKDIERIL
ncbi:alpha/beta hydrolase [Candidatus Microgenomates bacterium]|nr:alpha/beta hydrolase [Candidatus Microgenomates bacterium]